MHILDNFMIHYLRRFDKQCFTVQLHDKTYTIGEGQPLFNVIIHNDIPKKELLASTSLALGEAYMRKDIEIKGDLFTALRCFLSQTSQFSLDKSLFKRILYPSESKSAQKKQVSSHYDLGNDFYAKWLDPSMSYSCAYFKNEDDSLEQAQHNKVHYILEKLYLKEGMTLLDIGCGWGGLAEYMARNYQVSVVGVTISAEQQKMAQARCADLDVEIRLQDYRDLHDSFDRIVSVGMFEHVGPKNYATYFEVADRNLKPNGRF